MVTMPTEAATNFRLVEELIDAGMDTARINCAHDNEQIWRGMIDNIRTAAFGRNRDCRILMDLAGHKIRTGNTVLENHAQQAHNKSARRLYLNDWIVLSTESQPPESYAEIFKVPVKATITMAHAEIFTQFKKNQSVWFDDGKIGTNIIDKFDSAVLLQITHVGPKGARIKEEKGLNFPETRLHLPALEAKDYRDLDFVCQHADMVGLSFTEQAKDILQLHTELIKRDKANLPIIAKIETAHAVRELPKIISRALAENIDLGVLLARGDLAIELGSVRLAEIQEEILWLCEAAHVPVIWATQVLESLAKKGKISRPEITDAATSVRAECVMLNKGPYIQNAVMLLSDILQRMEAHQFKKFSRLRALHW
jgi:pyruvate kinase